MEALANDDDVDLTINMITQKSLKPLEIKIKRLMELGLSPLPIAPLQPNDDERFTGKNPSYLDADGIPHLIKHHRYQDRQPTAEEIDVWFANPKNGIGCLGSEHYIFLDFDRKHFNSQEDFDEVITQWEKEYPKIQDAYCDQTQSGGRRYLIYVENSPDFTNFSLEPHGKHIGEALGKGRFAVLAPTVGVNGNYINLGSGNVVKVDSLADLGIFSIKKLSKHSSNSRTEISETPEIPEYAHKSDLALNPLLSKNTLALLQKSKDQVPKKRSDYLAAIAQEAVGWQNFLNCEFNAKQIIEAIAAKWEIENARLNRILTYCDFSAALPAVQEHSDIEAWKKVYSVYPDLVPNDVKEDIQLEYAFVVETSCNDEVAVKNKLNVWGLEFRYIKWEENKSVVIFLSRLRNKEERAPINALLKEALPKARIIDKNKAELIKKIQKGGYLCNPNSAEIKLTAPLILTYIAFKSSSYANVNRSVKRSLEDHFPQLLFFPNPYSIDSQKGKRCDSNTVRDTEIVCQKRAATIYIYIMVLAIFRHATVKTLMQYALQLLLFWNEGREKEEALWELLKLPDSLIRDIDFSAPHLLTCKVFNDFVSGGALSISANLGILSSLIHIKGGEKYFKRQILQNKHYSPTLRKTLLNLTTLLGYISLLPMRIGDFSPYEEEIDAELTLLDLARSPVKYTYEVTEPLGDQRIADDINGMMQADDLNIHLGGYPCGAGKTERVIQHDNIAIAAPTHRLKDEISERRAKLGKPIQVSPELPQDIPDRLRKPLDLLYHIGAFEEANMLITDYSDDYPSLQRYLEEQEDARRTTETLITTHSKLLHLQHQHSTYIFDEEPPVLEVGSCCFQELSAVNDYVSDEGLKQVLESKEDIVYPTPLSLFPLIRRQLTINRNVKLLVTSVYKFFASRYYVKIKDNIHFINVNLFPRDKKIIISSATINEFIYKKLFGDRLRVCDRRNIKLKGKLKQDLTHSFSRTNYDKHLAPEIKEYLETNYDAVITFNKFKGKFCNGAKDTYFHNSRGYDSYGGKNLAIVGTPHYPVVVYQLYAAALGIEFKNDMAYRYVKYNGYRFRFFTFSNLELQQLHLSMINSELEQAVGRARLLRNNNEVLVLSNLPLKHSELIRLDGKRIDNVKDVYQDWSLSS